VVGAGPAGLEAARVSALRGHSVFLADRSRSLGGTLRDLAVDVNRRNLLDLIAYYETQLPSLVVQHRLRQEVEADDLAGFRAHAVLVATGARPSVPEVPGIHAPNVLQWIDVLRGGAVPTERVVVVGGLDNHVGPPTIAEFLADQGKRVDLLTEQFDFASGAE